MSVERFELKSDPYHGDTLSRSDTGNLISFSNYSALEARLKEAEEAINENRGHGQWLEKCTCLKCAYLRKYPKKEA